MPLLLPKYPCLSPDTPTDLLATTPAAPQQKSRGRALWAGLPAAPPPSRCKPSIPLLSKHGRKERLSQEPVLLLRPSSPLLFPSLERRRLGAEEPGDPGVAEYVDLLLALMGTGEMK